MSDREDNVYKAKLAEQAERYDEMVACMNKVAKSDVELVTEERNLLSVAYKNVIGARRASWRVVKSMQDKEEKSGCAEEKINLLKDYKEKIEEELSAICKEINDLIDTHLLQNTSDPESLVFYNKMKGDYYRYQAEYVDSEKEQPKIAGESLKAYKAASDTANNQLASTNPIRLGLALNFSVFYYEIIKKPVLACRLAKAAFDDAIAELDAVPEVDYKDSTLIMQLLRDNLTLWTTDLQGDDDKCDVEDLEVEAAE